MAGEEVVKRIPGISGGVYLSKMGVVFWVRIRILIVFKDGRKSNYALNLFFNLQITRKKSNTM